MIKNIWIKKGAILLVALTLIVLITGCSSKTEEVDYSKLILVTYDGNGGYLRNKTDTVRKLRVQMNSKIPAHVDPDNPGYEYALSSLGKAARSGYFLGGWYLEENATYKESATGDFVYLDKNYNNGVYTVNTAGDYVFKYQEDPNGTDIFIYVEEASAGNTNVEYIFFEGSNGLGFYVYDSDNADHAEIYEKDGSYKPEQVQDYGKSYLVFDSLTQKEKELFADAKRYTGSFETFTPGDEGYVRYSLESGYVQLDAMMVVSASGLYVEINNAYVLYDDQNPNHQGLERFSIDSKYLFTPSEDVYTPSDLTRYSVSIIYWDFATDRVTKDITLKAHWIKRLTVEFYQPVGPIKTITTKRNPENTKDIPLVAGEPIGKLEAIPLLVDHTFVNWSKSETEYIPWNFETDVFPLGTSVLKLYPYMVEGTYTRIASKIDLEKVAKQPDGKFLLVNDIDLKGAEYSNSSPLGFIIQTKIFGTNTTFTGEFLSLGHKIANFKLKVSNVQKSVDISQAAVVVSGLFPHVQNAKIEGLIVKDLTVVIDNNQTGTNVVYDLGAAGLIGTSLEGNTIVKDCQVELTFVKTSQKVLDRTVYVGDIVGRGKQYTTITNSTASIDYTALEGITTGTIEVQTLN